MNKIVFTDLDGTLLNSQWQLSARNRETLRKLIDSDIIIVVVTGRSLYSAIKVLGDDFPMDYLIFSTGAGIMNWKTKEIIYKKNISDTQVTLCVETFLSEKINFMLHREIPDSHFFYYHLDHQTPEDFNQRLDIYAEFAEPFSINNHHSQVATQFLSILRPDRFQTVYDMIKERLETLSIVKTTSPLTGRSLWLEIYAPEVSKGKTSSLLAQTLGVSVDNTMAVGNDYNDSDLLEWSMNSFVVDNAPWFLKDKYTTVSSNDQDGFSEAVSKWLT
ncbi:MAG: HAD family hydrolase [Candidatus Cloacimonetes bacterium]|nr:HAD family hydrolase [Candidatus Cloacimonadota bacterium]